MWMDSGKRERAENAMEQQWKGIRSRKNGKIETNRKQTIKFRFSVPAPHHTLNVRLSKFTNNITSSSLASISNTKL